MKEQFIVSPFAPQAVVNVWNTRPAGALAHGIMHRKTDTLIALVGNAQVAEELVRVMNEVEFEVTVPKRN